MKKGFTLVELLAVLTLIAVLSLITVPIVSRSINSSKDSLNDNQEQMILKAAIDWAGANTDKLPINSDNIEEKTVVITLGYLKSQGYITSSIKDPQTGYLYPNDMIINITYDENKVIDDSCQNSNQCVIRHNGNYRFVLDLTSGNKDLQLEEDVPVVSLNICGTGKVSDNNNYNVFECIQENIEKIYSGYNDVLNVQLDYYKNKNEKIEDLVSYNYNGFNVMTIDMSKYGFYYVYYSDINNPDKTDLKIFMINDTQVPTLDFTGFQDEYDVNSNINLSENVTCKDNSGYCTIKISGFINPSVSGKYVMSYIASDHSGNTNKVKKIITVK